MLHIKYITVLVFMLLFSQSALAQSSALLEDYHTIAPHQSEMYAPAPGYRLEEQKNISPPLAKIAQEILSRAISEHWPMPSEIPLVYKNKQYMARFQYHGANKYNPKKHFGVGLYVKIK